MKRELVEVGKEYVAQCRLIVNKLMSWDNETLQCGDVVIVQEIEEEDVFINCNGTNAFLTLDQFELSFKLLENKKSNFISKLNKLY